MQSKENKKHEFEQALRVSEGQRNLVCCNPWGHKESEATERLSLISYMNSGDMGSTPGLGRYPGEENGYPLQYSCGENSMDRGAWQATVHGVVKSWTRLRK